MKKNLFLIILSLVAIPLNAQNTLSKLLEQENKATVPYISVNALQHITKNVTLLDAREAKEYNVSHLKNAIHVGYDFFNLDAIQNQLPKKNAQIVVYCSLGIRSEDIAEHLKKAGYTNVFNLYGGIFEWKNNNLDLVNTNDKKTDSVHVFSKAWSKWLEKGTKIYD
jgi:rhodanese-related sulfurtransferase